MSSIKEIAQYVISQFSSPRIIIDIIDITLVSFVIYYVYRFIKERRAIKLALGIIFVILFLLISQALGMRAMNFILSNLVQVGLIAIIILFQPELRSALEKMGGGSFKSIKGIAESKDNDGVSKTIDIICATATDLSHDYTGALIIIERSTPLGDITATGITINADVNQSLLKNIFYNKAPLHDGAVIIKGSKIIAAGCFLPMSTNDDIIKDLGTRHRSAIGMSENSDAVIIVVSEETGTVSVATNGELKRNYDYNTLKSELQQLLGDEQAKKHTSKKH